MTNPYQSQSNQTELYGTATTVGGQVLEAQAEELLMKRGITSETATSFGVTSFAKNGGDWVAIPYFFDGKKVNTKYRRVFKSEGGFNFQMEEGGKLTFWNADILKDKTLNDEPLYIWEGEFDAMIAVQCGYIKSVSVPNGAAKTASENTARYDYLDELTPYLKDCKQIIIGSDGDDAGAALLRDLSVRLGKAKCKYLKYPKGCKDISDAYNQFGEKGVHKTIERANFVKVDGIYRMSELPPVPKPKPHSLHMGPVMDGHINIRLGDFCVLTGIPSMGKSTILNDITCRQAEHNGFTSAFASFEQHPATDHKENLRRWYNKKPEYQQSEAELRRADEWIDEYFSFIVPNDDDLPDLEWSLDKAASSVIRHNAKILIFDPWNEIDHVRPNNMSLTEYTGFAIKQFKRLAKSLDVWLCVAAHPSKQKKLEDGSFQIPTLYDISDSAHWYNKADLGLIVHQQDGKSILRNAKSRYHNSIGKPGDIELIFNSNTGRYDVIDPAYKEYENEM